MIESVNNLPPDVIKRIQPCDRDMVSVAALADECKHYENLDSEQIAALTAILHESLPSSPPILISGPFGTGKTRVMANAAHYLFQRNSTHILVCTQQRESADNFMSMYREAVSASGHNDYNVKSIILRDYGRGKPNLKKYYLEPKDLIKVTRKNKFNLLIVTTCLTARHLAGTDINFSHIFIDEGAQMREPEAVAALAMAKSNTKLVIAGDPQQVMMFSVKIY